MKTSFLPFITVSLTADVGNQTVEMLTLLAAEHRYRPARNPTDCPEARLLVFQTNQTSDK